MTLAGQNVFVAVFFLKKIQKFPRFLSGHIPRVKNVLFHFVLFFPISIPRNYRSNLIPICQFEFKAINRGKFLQQIFINRIRLFKIRQRMFGGGEIMFVILGNVNLIRHILFLCKFQHGSLANLRSRPIFLKILTPLARSFIRQTGFFCNFPRFAKAFPIGARAFKGFVSGHESRLTEWD